MDDWMIIDSSSSEDDEPSKQREIMLESKKGAAHTRVSHSNQAHISPVLNPTVNETVHIEEDNVTNLNLFDRMKDHIPSSLPIETPASPSLKNSPEYSTAITASNCTPVVSCKETEDIIPSVDVKQVTDTSSTCISLSAKKRDDLCSSSDVSEGWMGLECISPVETEVVDMIESMPNSRVSHSEPITSKFSSSGKEATFCEPCATVIPKVSGSSVPKNLGTTETFDTSLKQTSDRDPTCLTSLELKFKKFVGTPVGEATLRSESAADRKKSVGLKLSDRSKEKMSRAVGKDEDAFNVISSCNDHFDTEDVIIISDDEDDIFRESENLNKTSDISSVCVKNSSVSASRCFSELTKGDTQEILEHLTEFTHISDTSPVVIVEKAKEVGRELKKIDVYLSAKGENKNATLEDDLSSSLSNVDDHQQPSVSYKVSNHQPSNQNRLDRHQLLPRSHENDDHQQLFTSKKVNDHQQPNLHMDDYQQLSVLDKHNFQQLSNLHKDDDHKQLLSLNKNGDHKKTSVLQRVDDHNQPSNFQKKDDHQQQLSLRRPSDHHQSSDFHYYDDQYSSHIIEVEGHQQSSDLDKIDKHQEQFDLHGIGKYKRVSSICKVILQNFYTT